MALDPGGAGGSGSGGICSASPFDIDAKVDNLISRVDRIEQVLSELLGVDITAIQLSDITQNGGTLTSLNLTGGALSQIVTNLGRSNVYMVSNLDAPFPGDDTGFVTGISGIDGYSPAWEFTGSGTLHRFAGNSSLAPLYRYDAAPYNGGFHFECRMMISPGDFTLPLAKTRAFVGLGLFPIFASSSDANADAPDTGYICFNYSEPRGDTTWKFMRSDNPTGTGFNQWHQVIVDTGVPMANSHWYDFIIDCKPNTNALNWTITDTGTGQTASGTLATPDIWHGFDGFPDLTSSTYYAGFGVYCSTAGVAPSCAVHHAFCQTLSTDRIVT